MKKVFLFVILGLLIVSCNSKKEGEEAKDKEKIEKLKKMLAEKEKKEKKNKEKEEKQKESKLEKLLKEKKIDLKKIDIEYKAKKCKKDDVWSMLSDELKEKLLYRRITANGFMGNYKGIAKTSEKIAETLEHIPKVNKKYLLKAAVNYGRSGDHIKANSVFSKLVNKYNNDVKSVARYAIFLAYAKSPTKNLSLADQYANSAWRMASSKEERRYAADALAELANKRFGHNSACQILMKKTSYSYSDGRCKELKSNYSRYRIKVLKNKMFTAVRLPYRKLGIPKGEVECNEVLSAHDIEARDLSDDKQYEAAVMKSKELLSYEVEPSYFVEWLTNYAEYLYNAGKEKKSLLAFDYAIKMNPNYHYPLGLKASILNQIDQDKYRSEILSLTEKSLKICRKANSRCLFQGALNLYRIGLKERGKKLAKKGYKTFRYMYQFKRLHRSMKRGRKL